MSNFKKWNSINKFSDAYHMAQKQRIGDVVMGLKIKLHGTNAGIRLEDGGVLVAQKRTSDVHVGKDNAGFATWVATLKRNSCCVEYFKDFVIHGEWAGQGVQSGDAVTQTPKAFYVFAVENVTSGFKVYDPVTIVDFLRKIFTVESLENIHIIPWFGEYITFNFLDQKSAQDVIDLVLGYVDAIAECDPYIKSLYDVEGPGEGLVGYFLDMIYQDGTQVDPQYFDDYMFKVKSIAHSIQKNKVRNKTGPEKAEGIDEFIEMFFTENRFQQMLDEHCDGVADKKNTGVFMKAVMGDVHKESVNEIEVADFEWKDVPKFAMTSVRQWFFDQCDKL